MSMNEQFPLALPEGTILAGQYSIEKVLGQGGFGITYRANDHKTGQKVAVKEFFPDTLAYREVTAVISYPGERSENFTYGKEGFLQEAQTLAEFIGNENIVRIHSYFEENGTAYFVMDYIEGISFDVYLKNRGGKISCEEAKQVLIPVMDALGAVHSKGIVHRDVTPDNIYITNDGVVKLLDFGAARYSLGDKSRSLDVILKHGFAPKEQYTRRGKQGPFTDIYSLGATFYFAITGKRPPDSVDRLDEDELIPPSNLGVQITDYQERAILQAMSVQPSERFESMAVFKQVMLNENAPTQNNATNQIFFNAPPQQQPVQYAQQPVQYTQQITGGVQTIQTPMGVAQAVQPAQPVQPAANSELSAKVLQFIQKAKTAIMAHKKLSMGIAAAAVICIIIANTAGGGSPSNDDIVMTNSGKGSSSSNSGGGSSNNLDKTTKEVINESTRSQGAATNTEAEDGFNKIGDLDLPMKWSMPTNGAGGQSEWIEKKAFDCSRITPDTIIKIEYKIDGELTSNKYSPVKMVLANYNNFTTAQPQIWAEINPIKWNETSASFAYEDMTAAYGSEDFSTVDELIFCDGNIGLSITVTKITVTNCYID